MPGKLTLYPSEGTSRHFLLREGQDYRLGRDPGNELVIDDSRISASHAAFRSRGAVWLLEDAGSKNGTFVNAVRITEAPLQDTDWVSFGGLLTRFEIVSEADAEELRSERTRRLNTFTEARRILDTNLEPKTLLSRLISSVLEVTGAERGFLLLFTPDGRLRAEVVSGFGTTGALGDIFDGSLGAIERALRTGRSVVTSNAKADAYLGRRPSVIELGIETLACVPLRSGDQPAGLIYVDGRKRGGAFTDLDLEILEALSDHTAVVVESLHLDREIRELVGAPAPEASAASKAFLEDFDRRIGRIARAAVEQSSSP